MPAYYNEIDPTAAHILRALIAENVIAPGEIDTRSIKEVRPDDLIGFTQCHFFAGGGLWSVAARLAGWPDDEPLWTGSCPCQPFSAAGKGGGTDDPRHLWPDFYRLIRARRPAVVMGEQVAGKAGYGWFDGVSADLEREDFASRTVDFPACSIDAPHQRNRLYWAAVNVADSYGAGPPADGRDVGKVSCISETERGAEHDAALSWRGNGAPFEHLSDTPEGVTQGEAFGTRLEGQRGDGNRGRRQEPRGPASEADGAECHLPPYADGHRRNGTRISEGSERERISDAPWDHESIQPDAHRGGRAGRPEGPIRLPVERTASQRPLLRNGTYWSDAEWIACHDDKARRAKSGLRFLVDGLPGRVDLWRVGGNAIVPEAAAEVIAAFVDVYGIPSSWLEAA